MLLNLQNVINKNYINKMILLKHLVAFLKKILSQSLDMAAHHRNNPQYSQRSLLVSSSSQQHHNHQSDEVAKEEWQHAPADADWSILSSSEDLMDIDSKLEEALPRPPLPLYPVLSNANNIDDDVNTNNKEEQETQKTAKAMTLLMHQRQQKEVPNSDPPVPQKNPHSVQKQKQQQQKPVGSLAFEKFN
jgi:hypothetical protein